MTNWVTTRVFARTVNDEEIEQRVVEIDGGSELSAIALYELGCMDEEAQAPLKNELNLDRRVDDWLGVCAEEEAIDADDDEILEIEGFWQDPREAARKFKALSEVFARKSAGAQRWWAASENGIFERLFKSALDGRVHDSPSPGCASGDGLCHLAYCFAKTAEALEAVAESGDEEVLITFHPF